MKHWQTFTTSALLALSVAGSLTGCASSSANTNTNANANANSTASAMLSQYQTFGFAPVSRGNGRAMSLAQNEVSEQLMARGMIPSSNPDLLVNVRVSANPQYQMPRNPNQSASLHADVRSSTEGHLTIDLLDARQKQVIWRGQTSHPITRRVLNNPERAMDQAVTEVFRSFPPRSR